MKPCSEDLDRREMSRILKENMIHYEGVGLSANQIGINERVFVMILHIFPRDPKRVSFFVNVWKPK